LQPSLYRILLEAISKGPQLAIKIDGSSSYAGKVFWPNFFVGASFKILEIHEYACGFRPTTRIKPDGSSSSAGKLGPAANLNQHPLSSIAG
jgi:hypothetical protein